MAETYTYYAVLDSRATREEPAGLARRVKTEQGFRDEAIGLDLNWRSTPVVAEWRRGESSLNLIEVSDAEAQRIIEYFRQKG